MEKYIQKPIGFGDTVANTMHRLGVDRLAHKYSQATGKDCGCKGRQDKLNKIFPYKK
tara:strand:- start:1083 stop:1253 length:171 start_codon:yes stop_codon:yes gene_type:complete